MVVRHGIKFDEDALPSTSRSLLWRLRKVTRFLPQVLICEVLHTVIKNVIQLGLNMRRDESLHSSIARKTRCLTQTMQEE